VLALNGFMMCFRLLHIVRLSSVFGPLVLMVLKVPLANTVSTAAADNSHNHPLTVDPPPKMFNDLMYFLGIFFILLAGFTVTMHAMFRDVRGYGTLGESFLTLFLAALGEFDFESLQVSALCQRMLHSASLTANRCGVRVRAQRRRP
jgi:hypothetical protein